MTIQNDDEMYLCDGIANVVTLPEYRLNNQDLFNSIDLASILKVGSIGIGNKIELFFMSYLMKVILS